MDGDPVTEVTRGPVLHSHTVRLGYADTDSAGILYYATWFPRIEALQTEFFYLQGLRQDTLTDRFGWWTVTRATECEYFAPAHLFDQIRIELRLGAIGASSFHCEFEMWRIEDGVRVARASLTIVTVSPDQRPVPIPPLLRRHLEAWSGESPSPQQRIGTSVTHGTSNTEILEARLLVSELIARIAQLADSGTVDDYIACFAPDASWELVDASGLSLTPQVRRGHGELRAGVHERRRDRIQGPGTHTKHDVSTIVVTSQSDRATARSYFRYYLATDDTPKLHSMGTYDDEFVRTRDGWRLSRRVIRRD